MKIKIILIIFLSYGINANAQFWKKLKKKVENSVENVVTDKVARKASDKTNQVMENILNPDFSKNSPVPIGGKQGNLEDVPDQYQFNWVYTLQIENNKSAEKMDFKYHLKNDAPYFGIDMGATTGQKGMFMVYDASNNLTTMFLDMEGNKVASVYKNSNEEIDNLNLEANDDYTFEKIGNKKVLGYNCQGFIAENDSHKMTYYLTFEADVSFGQVYGKSQNLPKNFNPEWLEDEGKEGLMMEMVFKDKKQPSNNATMQCVKLKERKFTINKLEYKSFAGMPEKN